jgi:hypothetical protein
MSLIRIRTSTNGSGSGSWRPKNMRILRIRILIPNTHAHCVPAEAHGVLDAPVDSSLLERALLAAPGLEVLPAVRTDSLQRKKRV